jgi:hypothetical protein
LFYIISSFIKQGKPLEGKIVLAPIVFQGKLGCFINIATFFDAFLKQPRLG